jgi:hypothetical protein
MVIKRNEFFFFSFGNLFNSCKKLDRAKDSFKQTYYQTLESITSVSRKQLVQWFFKSLEFKCRIKHGPFQGWALTSRKNGFEDLTVFLSHYARCLCLCSVSRNE